MPLDEEHEGYLRELCGNSLSEERIQELVDELTIEEFWRRVYRLQQAVTEAKREHHIGRPTGQRRRPRRG